MLQNNFVADENIGNVKFATEFIRDTCHSPSWVLHITKYRGMHNLFKGCSFLRCRHLKEQ